MNYEVDYIKHQIKTVINEVEYVTDYLDATMISLFDSFDKTVVTMPSPNLVVNLELGKRPIKLEFKSQQTNHLNYFRGYLAATKGYIREADEEVYILYCEMKDKIPELNDLVKDVIPITPPNYDGIVSSATPDLDDDNFSDGMTAITAATAVTAVTATALYEKNWTQLINECKTYIAANNELPRQSGKLGKFYSHVKKLYKSGELDDAKKKDAEDIRVKEAIKKYHFNDWLELYKKYKLIYHSDPLPSTTFNQRDLGGWYENQQAHYDQNKLSKEQTQILLQLGIISQSKRKSWDQYYNELDAYVKQNKSLPPERHKLRIWYNGQKRQNLPKDLADKLRKLSV